MYDIEISKKELDTILVALRDSKERISNQKIKLNCSYSKLPKNLKFLWKDEATYEKYINDAIKECNIQINEIDALEERLEQIICITRKEE